MKVSIDRIEDGIAVLVMRDDTAGQIRVPVALLPPGCGEGDVLTLTLERDPAGTVAARERVSGLIEKLRKKR
jgi:hypothetical protein